MRLIDADHVLKRNGLDHAGKYHEDGHINREALDTMMLYEVKEMIEEAPTVDAVEIVRCKDCAHCTALNLGGYICENKDTPWYREDDIVRIKPDDYCSCGEKEL